MAVRPPGDMAVALIGATLGDEGMSAVLAQIAARCGADEVLLRRRRNPGETLRDLRYAVPPLAQRTQLDELARPTLLPLDTLRPRRTYALAEFISADDVHLRSSQQALLRAKGIVDLRVIRIPAGPGSDAWIVLLSHARDFTAAAGATLIAIEPAFAAALQAAERVDDLRALADARADVLDRLGITLSARAPGQTQSLTRTPRPIEPQRAEPLLQAEFGLSQREAQLAVALSNGTPLIAAGAGLGLSRETTRNYSKQIYAKTGASGQADLVRLVLTSAAAVA